MHTASQKKWNKIYSERDVGALATASEILRRNQHYLPEQGRALDYACGRGGNALLLAELGLQTDALDISDVVVEQLQQSSREQDLDINAQARDLSAEGLAPSTYDVIVCSYYLSRPDLPQLINALKSDGLLFFETFNASLSSGRGPSNPDFLLNKGELLQLFDSFDVLFYQELWGVEDGSGQAGVSRIVARQSSIG